jgi:gamma-D-glutamyl-L-lysine dipeptidyl-peptidase
MQKEISTGWPTEAETGSTTLSYGVCRLSVASIYLEPRPGSGLLTQLLFGETYTVVEWAPGNKYLRVESFEDKIQGWLLATQHQQISQKEFLAFNETDYQLTTSAVSQIVFKHEKLFLLPGSHIHVEQHELFDLSQSIQFEGRCRPRSKKATREEVIEIAKSFINAPFLSGGRSYFGLGSGSLVQLIFKIAGHRAPKFLSQMIGFGKKVSSGDARPGDVLIFGNEKQLPEHMGIYMGDNRVIRMRGKVLVEPVDFDVKASRKNISVFPNVLDVRNIM